MPNNGPIPSYPSLRLIGLEIEMDAGGTELRLPEQTTPGWTRQSDGSLRNGIEMILNPPLTITNATPVVKQFSDDVNRSRTNTCKRGGFHVHVQVPDYDLHHAGNLARLYAHFQVEINRLVGKSRVGNTYCPAFSEEPTDDQLSRMFTLGTSADSRESAKSARIYKVVNFAMMRCSRPVQRTVEFRQGSTTKRFECIIGWAAFCMALVDSATHEDIARSYLAIPASWTGLVNLIHETERLVGAQHVAEWVTWRRQYLEELPTDEMVSRAVASMGRSPHGIFHVSRILDVNLPLSERILETASSRGLVTKIGSKYQANFASFAGADLASLEEAAAAREAATPAQPTVQPGEEE